MKKILFVKFFVLLLFITRLQCEDFTDKIQQLLESSKFDKAWQFIEKIDNLDRRKLYTAVYYMYTGDYNKANEYIKEISTTNIFGLDKEMKFYYVYIPQLYNIISNGYSFYESKHFVVALKDRDVILKDTILTVAEQIYKFYGEKFKFYPEGKIRIEVYNTKDEFSFASTLSKEIIEKTGVVGICKFNRIMLVSPECLTFGYRWCDTLAHEYIHFLLNCITEFTYPLYLHEGTARYFDTLYRSTEPLCFTPGNLKLLLDAKKNNSLIPFQNIKGSLVYLDSQEQVDLAFVELASFIEYLLLTFGEDKFLDLIHNYKFYYNKEDELFYKIFSMEYNEIVSNWEKEIEKKIVIAESYSGAQSDTKLIISTNETNLVGLNIKQYIELGDKFLANKNYKAAIYQYEKAMSEEKNNPVVLTKLAKVYILTKQYLQAENILLQCVKTNPNFVGGYELLVKLYYEKGEYDKIFNVYKNVIEINPFNYEIRKIMGEVYSDIGKLEKSLEEYKIVKVLNPKDTEVDMLIKSLEQYINLKKDIK